MATENAATTDLSAAVAAQDANLAPQKTPSKKGASQKKGVSQSQKARAASPNPPR
jgi:hypothetical protein